MQINLNILEVDELNRSFASVLVLPISSALFYPPNPKGTSTLSLPTSNRTAPYIFLPSFVPEGNCKKKLEDRPHKFIAFEQELGLQEIQKYQLHQRSLKISLISILSGSDWWRGTVNPSPCCVLNMLAPVDLFFVGNWQDL
ncbi:hypothetical protein V6Z11_D01G174800 [Gossypium hirsutum]